MALDCGPDSTVRVPGARANCESRDVAKVRVVKGSDDDDGLPSLSGRWGPKKVRSSVGKLRLSIVVVLLLLLD